MAEVKAFQLPGVKLWFWPNDHAPPHFHAKRDGEWEYKVNFMEPDARMFEEEWSVKRNKKPTRDLKQIRDLVKEHREKLYDEWQKSVQVDP